MHHIYYIYMASILCVIKMCLTRSLFSEYTLLQCIHWYGLSPLYVVIYSSNENYMKILVTNTTMLWFLSSVCLWMSFQLLWKSYHNNYLNMNFLYYVSLCDFSTRIFFVKAMSHYEHWINSNTQQSITFKVSMAF